MITIGITGSIASGKTTASKIISFKKDIFANKKGWIKKIHTRELGLILIELGGGRKQVTDKINFFSARFRRPSIMFKIF